MARKKIYTDRFNRSYKAYRKRYFSQQRKFEKRNRKERLKGSDKRYIMREDVMTKADYYVAYRAYKEDLQERGIKNPNVNQYIVADQAYERSQKQYRALKARGEELQREVGIDVSKMTEIDFRTGRYNEELDEAIKSDYYYLREELGLNSYQARKEISMLYFGSK